MKNALKDIEMVFLVSRGRSGSTLLQSILDAHSNVIAPLESKFVLHLNSKYKHQTTWNDKVINEFVNDLFTNRKIRLFWNLDKEKLILLMKEYKISSFQEACKVVYLSFPSVNTKKDVKIIIDKNPAYSRFIDELLLIFPDAKFIHLIRDPRAAISSQIKAFNRKSSSMQAYLWVFINKKIYQHKNSKDVPFCTLKYESLVNEPRIQVSKLFEFLKLPFEEQTLESHKALKPLTESNNYLSLPHHQNIGNPINTDSLNKWKKELSLKQIHIINSITNIHGNIYEYDIPNEELSFSESVFLKISTLRVHAINSILKLLFSLPFSIRKFFYNLVSLFFDKKYLK